MEEGLLQIHPNGGWRCALGAVTMSYKPDNRPMCITQTFRHASAVIKIKPAGTNGVIQADYFGVFTEDAARHLMPHARQESDKGRVLLVRIDRAVIAGDVSQAVKNAFSGSSIPGAVVVRPDQRQDMSAICSALSSLGTLRLVFLDHAKALAWADHLAAGLAAEEAARLRRGTPSLGRCDRLLAGCRIGEPANEQTEKTLLRR